MLFLPSPYPLKVPVKSQIPIIRLHSYIHNSTVRPFYGKAFPNLTPKLCAWILLDFFSVRKDKRKEEIQ